MKKPNKVTRRKTRLKEKGKQKPTAKHGQNVCNGH